MKHKLVLTLLLAVTAIGWAQTISRIDTIQTVQKETVTDTLMHVASRTDSLRTELAPVVTLDPSRKGHYVQGGLGVGYGSMQIVGTDNGLINRGTVAAIFNLQYAWFFHENWGVGIGIGASTNGGRSTLNTAREWPGVRREDDNYYIVNDKVRDSDGELYNHFTVVKDWTEQQRIYSFSLPISIQYQKLFSPKGGVYAEAGADISLPLSVNYRLRSGELEHSGYYPWSHLWLYENSGKIDYQTERIGEGIGTERHKASLRPVQIDLKAELGGLFPVDANWDIMLGAYIRYAVNNMAVSDLQSLGWRADDRHAFMNEYPGVLNSTLVKSIHPMQVGLRLAAQWHYRQKNTHTPVVYTPFTVYDTTYTTSQRVVEHIQVHYDTIYAVQEIKHLMDKSIIWFDINSYQPKLDPADILDRIAEVLVQHPELRIEVNGHTCTVGKRQYNMKLSEKRAQAVADRLIQLGVQPRQITTHGYCSDKPYYSEVHQLFLDRRVEIIPIEE